MPPLLADFTHARPCKPFCEKYLTLPIVPYTAIKNLDRNGVSKETTHFRKTLRAIFCICELAGFRVCGRVVLEDLKTGKIWS